MAILLTERTFATIETNARRASVIRRGTNLLPNTRSNVPSKFEWLALVTAWEPLGSTGRRWKYAHQPKLIDANDELVDPQAGHTLPSGTVTDNYALNLNELNNQPRANGWQGTSVNEQRPGYPAGFNLLPVGGEDLATPGQIGRPVPVVMWWYWRNDRTAVPVFYYINAHDGACDAP